MISLLATLSAHGADGVFVMGVDGMDPEVVDRMIAAGALPNLARLAQDGSYQRLGTTNPPQSPVAWSSFVTGMDPGGHGIFDFVHRDPATYHPISSATPPVEPGAALQLFGWVVPLGGSEQVNNRGGTPFWDLLARAGVDVEVYQIPGNFPTPESDAKVLDGMGTIDLRGGYGTYTWYTSVPVAKADAKGDIQLVTVQDHDLDGIPDTASGVLRGPPDVFHLPPGQEPTPADYLTVRVTFHVDPENDAAVIDVGGERVLLARGEWSGWVPVTFDALPAGLLPIEGMVRFYVRSLRPTFEVYASPVNLSPANPAMPITSPDDWSAEIRDALGRDFYTQGMPEETNALKDGVFTDDDYVRQVALVQQDTDGIVDLALRRFAPGDMTFVYLSDIDLQCHMLWRHGNPKYPHAPPHPAFDPDVSPRHADDIEGYYRDVDRAVGVVRGRLPAGTMLIVMSDHGFQPFTRKVNLNSWLRDQGYLVLKDGKTTGSIVAGDVDWSRTRAYGVGFNGLYLNLAGREAQGIVKPGAESDALLATLERELEAFTDPVSGARVVLDAVSARTAWKGDRVAEGPDLIVGYDRTYGASDDTTLGEIPAALLEDNVSRWSGNHLMAPEVVPGVLFVDEKLATSGHDLTDLPVSILRHYGVEPAPGMIGTPFF